MQKKFMVVMILLLMQTIQAIDSTYNIIIEDNGNSLVILELSGHGLLNVPIEEDVSTIKVKGALYMLKEGSVDLSIGSTNNAVMLYKTMYLTKKEGETWQLNFNTKSNITNVLLPKNTIVTKTVPNSFIEPGNYTKIVFENADNITVEYNFEEIISEDEEKSSKLYLLVVGIIAGAVIGYIVLKKPKKISKKDDFLKTLSQNEKIVVKILMENNGSMKRNELEKKSLLAKSSLANTLNILEKKKIISVDKTYTTHFVKLEGWFNDL